MHVVCACVGVGRRWLGFCAFRFSLCVWVVVGWSCVATCVGRICVWFDLFFAFVVSHVSVGCCVAGCVFVCVVVACFAVVFGGDRIVPVIPGGLCAFCVGLCCARLVVLSWLGQWVSRVSACEFMARRVWCRIIRPQACGVQSMASVLALVPPVCGWWDLQLAVGVMFVAFNGGRGFGLCFVFVSPKNDLWFHGWVCFRVACGRFRWFVCAIWWSSRFRAGGC